MITQQLLSTAVDDLIHDEYTSGASPLKIKTCVIYNREQFFSVKIPFLTFSYNRLIYIVDLIDLFTSLTNNINNTLNLKPQKNLLQIKAVNGAEGKYIFH